MAAQVENTVKKALIFALSLVLICSLTACGEPDDGAGDTSTDLASASTTEPADTTSQPEDTGDTSEAAKPPHPPSCPQAPLRRRGDARSKKCPAPPARKWTRPFLGWVLNL